MKGEIDSPEIDKSWCPEGVTQHDQFHFPLNSWCFNNAPSANDKSHCLSPHQKTNMIGFLKNPINCPMGLYTQIDGTQA